jgi:hypothetical protein
LPKNAAEPGEVPVHKIRVLANNKTGDSMRFTENSISFDGIYKNYEKALKAADDELREENLRIACAPPSAPQSFQEWAGGQGGMKLIACQLTDLTPDQITDLFGYYTSWAIYFEHQWVEKKFLKEAAVRAKKALEYALKVYFVEEEKVKLSHAQDHIRNTATWKAADQEVFRREVAAAKAELPFSGADKMAKALSRAQSKNSDMLRMQGRESNIGRENQGWGRESREERPPRRDLRGRPGHNDYPRGGKS